MKMYQHFKMGNALLWTVRYKYRKRLFINIQSYLILRIHDLSGFIVWLEIRLIQRRLLPTLPVLLHFGRTSLSPHPSCPRFFWLSNQPRQHLSFSRSILHRNLALPTLLRAARISMSDRPYYPHFKIPYLFSLRGRHLVALVVELN